MNDVKDAVSNEGSSHQPKVSLVAEYGKQHKSAADDDFNDEYPAGSAHHRKQCVIGGDHDHQGRIKRALAVKAHSDGQADHSQRHKQTNQVFHLPPAPYSS